MINNRATKENVKALVETAKKRGWIVDRSEDYGSVVQLKSPVGVSGAFAVITIGDADNRPSVLTVFQSTRGRRPARGLWHAAYALREDQQFLYQP